MNLENYCLFIFLMIVIYFCISAWCRRYPGCMPWKAAVACTWAASFALMAVLAVIYAAMGQSFSEQAGLAISLSILTAHIALLLYIFAKIHRSPRLNSAE